MDFLKVDAIRSRLSSNLDFDHAYDRGFRDAIESLSLALEARGEGVLLADLNTVLDALGNSDELGQEPDDESPSP